MHMHAQQRRAKITLGHGDVVHARRVPRGSQDARGVPGASSRECRTHDLACVVAIVLVVVVVRGQQLQLLSMQRRYDVRQCAECSDGDVNPKPEKFI